MRQSKFNHLIHLSINVLESLHGKKFIKDLLNRYGIAPIIHGKFATLAQNAYNTAVIKHYGFRTAENVFKSKLLMNDRAKSYCRLIDRYYITHNLYPLSNKSELKPYTVMITGKDGKPTGKNVLDKTNGKPTYQLYNQLHHQIMKQINKLTGVDYGAGRTEDPFHVLLHLIYSHPHKHGLIFSNSPLQIYKLKQSIIKSFHTIFGYKPVNVEVHMLYLVKNGKQIPVNELNLKDRLKAINKFIHYICEDYKIQIKDTDKVLFNNKDKKLTHNQRSLAFNSQIKATKGITTINHISTNKVSNGMKKQFTSNAFNIKSLLNPNYIYQINLVNQKIKKNNHKRINHNLTEIVKSNVIILRYKKNSSNLKNQSHTYIYSINIKPIHNQQQLMAEFQANVGNIVINKRASGIPP